MRAQLPTLLALMPADVQLTVAQDRSPTIRASLEEAEQTLMISVALVILVVFLFLRLWPRGPVIPGGGGAGVADRHLLRSCTCAASASTTCR